MENEAIKFMIKDYKDQRPKVRPMKLVHQIKFMGDT